MTPREKVYTIRLSDAEDATAKRVAEHLGLPLSSALRMLILEKGRELGLDFGAPKVAAKRKAGK